MPKDHWAYVPPSGERVDRRAIRIERHGRTWSGSYVVGLGKLMVESAHGSRTLMVGRSKDLKGKAEKALAAIVDEKMGHDA